MKLFATTLILCSALMLSACSNAETQAPQKTVEAPQAQSSEKPASTPSVQPMVLVPWKEGVHYKVLDKELSEEPVVVEYFSFWCPACYRFEPLAQEIKKQLGSSATFQKVHVNFMGFTSQEAQEMATLGMVIARDMGKEEEINASIFSRIHQQRNTIASIDDIKAVFALNGIDANSFEATATSDSVIQLFDTNNSLIENNRAALTGVPNFIVNGKYQATFTRDMNAQDVIELIKWLSTQR